MLLFNFQQYVLHLYLLSRRKRFIYIAYFRLPMHLLQISVGAGEGSRLRRSVLERLLSIMFVPPVLLSYILPQTENNDITVKSRLRPPS